jgi:hypothetical protein
MTVTINPTQQAITGVFPGQHVQQNIKSEIILGHPSSGCQGIGICRVLLHGEMPICQCRKVMAWVSKTKTGKLRVSFWKSAMDAVFVKKHFDMMSFQVNEAYELPRRITRAAGFSNKFSIKPGVYAVYESPGFLTVEF